MNKISPHNKILIDAESYEILVQGNFENNFKIIQKNKNGFEIEILKYPFSLLFHSDKRDKIVVYINKNKFIVISDSFEYSKFLKKYSEIERLISEFSTYISIDNLPNNNSD